MLCSDLSALVHTEFFSSGSPNVPLYSLNQWNLLRAYDGKQVAIYPDICENSVWAFMGLGGHKYIFLSSFFLTGLRDPIACSILGGGIPTQNSGYKSTRLWPLFYLVLCATFPVLKWCLWSPLFPLRDSPGFLAHQGTFPAHNLSLPLLPPLCPFVV